MAERLDTQEVCDIRYEVAQIAQSLNGFRARARGMISDYRRWKYDYERETDGFEKTHRAYEGIFVRRQMADAWRSYMMVNREYHEVHRNYRRQAITE